MPDPTTENKSLTVSASPALFGLERVSLFVEEGLCIAQIIAKVQPDATYRSGTIVKVGGVVVPQSRWDNVKPKHGHLIEINVLLHRGGNGGKSPLRTLLQIAVLAAAAVAAPYLAGAIGIQGLSIAGITGTQIAAGFIGITGNLLVNALVPPPVPKANRLSGTSASESQHYFISSASNQARPFEPIPRVLGKHKMFADKSAKEYTENVGDEQYLRALFTWGYGPLTLTDFKIGETSIEEFDGVEMEHRYGYEDDEPITLFPDTIHETPLSVAITQAAGWITRTTETDTDEFSIDIAFSNGLVVYNEDGTRSSATVDFEVRYAPTGTEDWTTDAEGSFFPARSVQITDVNMLKRLFHVGQQYPAPGSFHRYARIIMNKFDGGISVIYGNWNTSTQPPSLPQVPDYAVSLARVLVSDQMTEILPEDITDERSDDIPNRGDTTEFLATDGSGLSVNIAAGTLYTTIYRYTERRNSEIRETIRFKPPARGQWDVGVRRLTGDSTSDRVFDKSFLSALRSIKNEDPVTPPVPIAQTALRIKASGQINSVVNKLNCIAQSVLPVWDGESWDKVAATSNPASIAKEVLQGSANRKPQADNKMELESFAAFYDDCLENGWEYNSIIDYQSSVGEVLHDVVAAGRAFYHRPDGRFRITREVSQDIPVQHFTPRNTWGFEGEINFIDLPHALRVRFNNEDKGYESDQRLVFVDGYDENNATEYEDTDFSGITNADLIWKHGRYHLAVAYNRREYFRFFCDFENLRCVRGDLVLLQHDVPQFGLGSARVRTVTDNGTVATSFTIDDQFSMEDGSDYVVRFRLSNGQSLLAQIETEEGSGLSSFTFSEPIPLAAAPQAGDLMMFGESEEETIEVLVHKIDRGDDLTARLTCVNYVEAVYEADQGEAPAFDSSLSGAASIATPNIRSVRSDGSVLIRDPDGSLANRILITYDRPSSLFTNITSVQARFREKDSNGPWVNITVPQDQGEVSLFPVEAGDEYEYQIRYVLSDGDSGSWSALSTHVCIGKEAPPGAVNGLSAQQNGETITITFQSPPDLDLKGTEIRFIKAEL